MWILKVYKENAKDDVFAFWPFWEQGVGSISDVHTGQNPKLCGNDAAIFAASTCRLVCYFLGFSI